MSEYLPEDVIAEILKRLPVKSLVKCMSVCKTWNVLIKTPSFISTNLQTTLSKPHSHLFLLYQWVQPNNVESIFLHFDNDDFDELKQLPFPVAVRVKNSIPYFHPLGSSNGLVCLGCGQCPNMIELIFWNPSIQKYITLPPKPGVTETAQLFFGFGFDSRTNDYKLLVGTTGKSNFIRPETPSEAYLFSLNESSWKMVTAITPKYAMESEISFAFVNGALHWLGRRRDGSFENMILGFDISSEEYFVISLPESLIRLHPFELLMMRHEEYSIAVIRWGSVEKLDIDLWVMKKYGAVGSWTKMLHFSDQMPKGLENRKPNGFGFRKNGEVLLSLDGVMVSLDLNYQQLKRLGIKRKYGYVSVDSYVESLVLLDKGVVAGSVSSNAINHAHDSSG